MSTPALNPLVTKIRAAYPGAYDDMDDATLTKAVLAKYPQYSDLAAPPVPRPQAPMNLVNPIPTENTPIVGAMAQPFGEVAAGLTYDSTFRKRTAQGAATGAIPAALAAGGPAVAGALPAAGKVIAGAAAKHPMISSMIASELIGQARQIPYVGKFVPPYAEMLPWLLGGTKEGAAKSGAKPPIGEPDVYSPGYHQPQAQYAGQPPEPIPARSGLQLKGNVQPPLEGEYVDSPAAPPKPQSKFADAAPVEPRSPEPSPALYRYGPGEIAPEDVNAPNSRVLAGGKGVRTTPEPSRGLALPSAAPSEREATTSLLPPALTKKAVGQAVDNAFGVPQIKPGVKMRDQMKPTPASDSLLPGHTAVDSSAMQSFRYDPDAGEVHVGTGNNNGYIYSDVSPEQAADFSNSESKGKAWNDLRKNSTLTAKIVNGQRIAVKSPDNDLVKILKQSAADVKAKAPSAAAD